MYDSFQSGDRQEQLISFEKSYEAGEVIFEQWDKSTEMFILLEGQVSVFIDGIEVALIDEPGSYFGEMSALLDKPRSATVQALTHSRLLVVKQDMVEEFLAHSPRLGLKLTKILAQRLKETTEDLIEMSQLVLSGRQISNKLLKKIEALNEGSDSAMWHLSPDISKEIKDYSAESKSALIHITRRSKDAKGSGIGTSSTYSEQHQCFFHDKGKTFSCHVLKQKTQVLQTNIFDLFVYKAAVPGQQYINYLLAEVQVCPECHFATNIYSHFRPAGEYADPPPEFTTQVKNALHAGIAEREKIAHSFKARFYTLRRSHLDAIKAFELAAMCYETVSTARPKPHGLSLCRAGNFCLKAAHLAVEREKLDIEERFLKKALPLLEQSYVYLSGPNLFRTVYQLIGLYVFFGDFDSGARFFNYFQKLSRSSMVQPNEKKYIDKYLNLSRKIWQDRENLTREKMPLAMR